MKVRAVFLSFFVSSLPLWSLPIAEESKARRIRDHLLIQDVDEAVKEGRVFFEEHPESIALHMAYLEALCRKGEEVEALRCFSLFKGEEEKRRQVSEWLAWCVLAKAKESPLLLIRLYALLGVGFTHDAQAVPILLQEMRGSNALTRSLAVKLSASYGDLILKRELLRLLQEEKAWFVRLEVIQSIGSLKIVEAKKALEEIASYRKASIEEKAAATLALVELYDKVSDEELTRLLSSNRAGLRALAAEVIAHFALKEQKEQLLLLLQDPSSDVRVAAMRALAALQIPVSLDCLRLNLSSASADLSLTAAWLAAIGGYKEGIACLRKWIESDHIESKRLGSAACAAVGSLGCALAAEKIRQEKDLYTRVNLAMGLIGERKEIAYACDVLFEALMAPSEELWMWDQSLFRTLAPSRVRHTDQIPRYPQVIDQLTKLDILSVLCVLRYPKALDAVKTFLKKGDWGVTGAAAATRVQEGDERSLTLVRELLEDPDETIRMQAALVLATIHNDASSCEVLMQSYLKADKERKMHILEALGHVGNAATIPFLLEVLKEPFQGTRVVAASALIRCLYH